MFNVQPLFAQNNEIVGAIINELIDMVFTMAEENSMNKINTPSIDPISLIDTPLPSFNLKASQDEEKNFSDNKTISVAPEHLSFLSHPEEIDSSFQKENKPPISKSHVSFSLSSNQEEIESSPSSPTKNNCLQKISLPEIKEQKKLTKSLQDWCSKIESEAALLPEEEVEVSTKRAAIYAQGYSKVKEKLQTLLTLIENNNTLQNEQSVKTLASAARNLIIIASRTVAKENIRPIKEHYCFDDSPIEIPIEILPEEEIIPMEDSEASIVVNRTINTLQALQETKNVFEVSDSEVVKTLNKSQRLRAYRARSLVRDEGKILSTKKNLLIKYSNTSPEALVQVNLEQQQNFTSEKEYTNILYNLTYHNILSDPEDAKSKTIGDMITISHTSLETADQLIEMLNARKIH
ncbi:MAG: hypothetical protein A3F67_02290 [Verrucomicrobia bacterium RIFCSPHIGHO2_12_FULL_41_10]|nr:MAG: hypothetical protein A3F67_02290 [Verrucomicrobia bacterium RIFCSPHIGHO2_12_FULL_41_10]